MVETYRFFLLRTLPVFPDRGRAVFRHGQPSGDLFVFQESVGVLKPDLLQHEQQEGRREKACADAPAKMLQSF